MQNTTQNLKQLDSLYHRHPFTDHKALSNKGCRIITHAEGIYIYDDAGNKILDGMSGLWCVNIGYGRKEIAQVAYEQMTELTYYNSFFQCSHPPAIKLAEKLISLAPKHISQVFFTGSGSESNESIIRIVRYYWQLLGHKNKNVIISRKNAYHGSGIGSASLGGMARMHQQGGLPIPDIVHINQPYYYGEGKDSGLSENDFGKKVAQELEQKIIELGENRVAAFIAEPVQGAGGVIIPPASYWPEIKQICKQYDILLISDEVICGFGRLGQWFGSQYFQFEADLMPIAKGLSSGYLPIGGVMISEKVAKVLSEQGGEFYHGFTYSGHPAACAVALKNLEIIENENILQTLNDSTIDYFNDNWRSIASHKLVDEARCLGMLGALELRRVLNIENFGLKVRDKAFENGLVLRATGDTMIIAPPLIIEKDQLDELIEKTLKTLDDISKLI